LSEKGLGILAKKNYLPLKGMNLNTCTHCLVGKQHRVAFQRSSHRRSHVLDLVHTDVCSMIDKSLMVHCTLLVLLMITSGKFGPLV
jgi:hypothetical protein